jgi:hypothetical protein
MKETSRRGVLDRRQCPHPVGRPGSFSHRLPDAGEHADARLGQGSRLLASDAPGPGGQVGIHGTSDGDRNRVRELDSGMHSLFNRDVEELC